jgi:isoamyl acetate esterase
LWSQMRSQSNYEKFLQAKDDLHFNNLGYEFLTQILSPKIRAIAL